MIFLTFSSTNHAIFAEQILLDGGITVRVMPLPSAVRAGCGLCLRLEPEQVAVALAILHQNHVPHDGLYQRDVRDGQTFYLDLEVPAHG